jgi:hypothetical protein
MSGVHKFDQGSLLCHFSAINKPFNGCTKVSLADHNKQGQLME